MLISTKIRLTMLCLSAFELCSRWVPLTQFVLRVFKNSFLSSCQRLNNKLDIKKILTRKYYQTEKYCLE